MSRFTADMNERSIEYVRRQIERKNSPLPYYANSLSSRHVITDYDHWPYDRWFRGVYYFSEPVIAEREAGWRPQQQSCYNILPPPTRVEEPRYCFEAPCSTNFPCNPGKYARDVTENTQRFSDMCIVQNY